MAKFVASCGKKCDNKRKVDGVIRECQKVSGSTCMIRDKIADDGEDTDD